MDENHTRICKQMDKRRINKTPKTRMYALIILMWMK